MANGAATTVREPLSSKGAPPRPHPGGVPASGIIYYAFHTLKRADAIPGDNFDLAWERTKAAAFEVKP